MDVVTGLVSPFWSPQVPQPAQACVRAATGDNMILGLFAGFPLTLAMIARACRTINIPQALCVPLLALNQETQAV